MATAMKLLVDKNISQDKKYFILFRFEILKIIKKLKFQKHDTTFKHKQNLEYILKFKTCAQNLQ